MAFCTFIFVKGESMRKLVAIATLFGLFAVPAFAGDASAEFAVKGMVCNSCKVKAEKALKDTKGVQSASVDLEKGIAKVQYDDQKVTTEQLKKVIKDAG